MKKSFKVGFYGVIILFLSLKLGVCATASPNYGYSKEVVQYFYDGYVQCQPSYNDNGKHAARAYLTLKNGAEGTVVKYTDWGKNFNDSRILSTSYRYRDTLNPIAPKVTFNFNFIYASHNGIWPVSKEAEIE